MRIINEHFYTVTGFTLVEVLVSLILLSILLFGLDAFQITALRKTREAGYFAIASEQLVNLRERLTALQSQRGLATQIREWNNENSLLLPAGAGRVKGKFPDYSATLYWGKLTGECNPIQTGTSGCIQTDIHPG